MTNYEWLVKNKAELVKDILRRHLSKEKGIPDYCSETYCRDCDFRCGDCSKRTKEWLEAEHEAKSKDKNIKLVSYDKCKDCEHYGVWSQRCWNVYGCPKERKYECPNDEIIKKEVKIDAENESLSEAKREAILNELSFIKRQCLLSDGSKHYIMQSIHNAADEIIRIIEHKEQRSRQDS